MSAKNVILSEIVGIQEKAIGRRAARFPRLSGTIVVQKTTDDLGSNSFVSYYLSAIDLTKTTLS